jgi:hypothetical protein
MSARAWRILGLAFITACGADPRGEALVGIPDTTFFIPSAEIDATGGEDVTEALNSFFSAVPDSSFVRFPLGAQYRVEGTLYFRDRNRLSIDGNGARIFALTDGSDATPTPSFGFQWPRTRQHMLFVGGSEIAIRDLTIVGANPNAGSEEGAYVESLEGQHGLKFDGVRGVQLVRVNVSDVYGDFLYLGGFDGNYTSDVHVTGCRFERSGRQGVAITAAEDVVIENSHVGEVARTIFDIEPNTINGGGRRITIRNNTIGPCRHLLLSAGGQGPNVGEIELSDNTLLGMQLKIAVQAADGARRGPFRILRNTSDLVLGLPVPAMRFIRVDGIEIRGNVQPMVLARAMVGVTARESCGVTVTDNVFLNAILEAEIEPFVCPGT